MVKNGPIVIIEDDPDDQYLLELTFNKIGCTNELIFFYDGKEALEYLKQADIMPFLVLSDINMPKLSGIEIREEIFKDEGLSSKCIPFLFFSTGASQHFVCDAYALSVQGFFRSQAML